MGKGWGKGSAGDATPYIVTHALGIVVSLLAIICSSIAYVELNKYQVYLGFIMGVAALALIYNISATVEDCKRFDIAWSRAHDRFFCADLVLLILVTPIAIAGASLWQVCTKYTAACAFARDVGHVAYGVWCAASGEWRVARGTWHVARGTWRVSGGKWQVAEAAGPQAPCNTSNTQPRHQNVADAEDDGSQGISAFRGSVVLCWLIFLMTSVCGVQDYVAAQNDSGLLN
mmetsp:Transcript_34468/g.91508  ORF Transcript_34468/g.91508 Transcript_34468/m.91508 type:complete len:230 (+) Transcript_34468:242-931(+)